MTPQAEMFARILLERHRRICFQPGLRPNQEATREEIDRCTIYYSELCELADAPYLLRVVGNFLDEIAHWCAAHEYPPLNALAVSKEEGGQPGPGYDGAGGDDCHLRDWPRQVSECIAFTGYPPPDASSALFSN